MTILYENLGFIPMLKTFFMRYIVYQCDFALYQLELKMKSYYIQVPGWVYAMSAYGINKRDAIVRFRKAQGFNRMPKGFGIWEAN